MYKLQKKIVIYANGNNKVNSSLYLFGKYVINVKG